VSGLLERWREGLRGRGASVVLGATFAALLVLAIRWIVAQQGAAPPPRRVMQYTLVALQPPPPKAAPVPPPPRPQKQDLDEPEPTRVTLRNVDIPPPDAPPPAAAAAGPLALAAEGEGPGDAFNLAGNPGGRGLLSGGGLGDGSGDGVGGADPNARYAYYYARMQPDIEAVLRRSKRLSSASLVAELRIWWDESGRITRVQQAGARADPSLDEDFERLVGIRVRNPPPPDVPMPVVLRVSARRPQ